MLSRLIKIIILLGLVAFIAWAALCVYSNYFAQPDTGGFDLPESDEAVYSVLIHNTGRLSFTNDYETFGNEVGKRKYLLHGFWEIHGQDFVYKSADLLLDESIFGEITIKRR